MSVISDGRALMARPRKGEEKNAPERVAFRIPVWVRAGLDRLAAERSAGLSDIANEALVAYLKRHGIKPEKPQELEEREEARRRLKERALSKLSEAERDALGV
jgi:hypothetical protein